jgi:hypothetical protein
MTEVSSRRKSERERSGKGDTCSIHQQVRRSFINGWSKSHKMIHATNDERGPFPYFNVDLISTAGRKAS